jgi:protein-tyrosine phosphatase
MDRHPDAVPDSNMMLETSIGPCTVSPATEQDIQAVVRLRDDAARWLVDRGVEQWTPGEPVSHFEQRVALESTRLLRSEQELIGTVTILWSDPETWGSPGDDGRAGYIHGFIVDRRFLGKGVGQPLLAWAEGHITAAGRQYARLDCVRTNQRLRGYYEQAGYHNVGYKDFPDIDWAREVALYEKPLRPQERDAS